MTNLRTLHRSRPHPLGALVLPHIKMAGLVGLAAAPIVVAIAMAPRAAALPIICLVAFGLAALVAFAAWSFGARRHGDNVTPWDIAGAFVLIGCAAATLSDTENTLQMFGLSPN